MKRYYYRTKDGKGFLNLKSPLADTTGYTEITEAKFNELQPKLVEPTQEELARLEKLSQISRLKSKLSATDYVALKLAEALAKGNADAILEEYAEVLSNRETWRAEINELEEEVQ